MSGTNEQRLTWNQIRDQHPDEWVALIEVDADEQEINIRSAIVVGHAKSKKDVSSIAKATMGRGTTAVFFTGELGRGSYRF